MSNTDSKKRRVDSGIPAGGESGNGGGIQDELRDIKTMMQELINQNRITNNYNTNYAKRYYTANREM